MYPQQYSSNFNYAHNYEQMSSQQYNYIPQCDYSYPQHAVTPGNTVHNMQLSRSLYQWEPSQQVYSMPEQTGMRPGPQHYEQPSQADQVQQHTLHHYKYQTHPVHHHSSIQPVRKLRRLPTREEMFAKYVTKGSTETVEGSVDSHGPASGSVGVRKRSYDAMAQFKVPRIPPPRPVSTVDRSSVLYSLISNLDGIDELCVYHTGNKEKLEVLNPEGIKAFLDRDDYVAPLDDVTVNLSNEPLLQCIGQCTCDGQTCSRDWTHQYLRDC